MFRVLQAFYIYSVYAIFSVQAYKYLRIGRTIQDGKPMFYLRDRISELGLKGDNAVEQIRINGECYGEGNEGQCPEERKLLINAMNLDADEFINEIEYEWNTNITYLSFRTNKGQHIEAGNRKNKNYNNVPISSDWGYGRLDNIKVVSLDLKSGKYIQFLDISYYYPDWHSKVKATNVSLILSYTSATKIMTEYEDPDQRVADAYTTVYRKYLDDPPIQEEFVKKIGTNLKTVDGKIVPKKLPSNSTIKYHIIPDGYVGVEIAVGELLEGETQDWLFPTSVASYLVIKASDVSKLLGYYEIWDLSNREQLIDQMPDLMAYVTFKYGVTYYAYLPQEKFYFKEIPTASFGTFNNTGFLYPIKNGNYGYINEVEYESTYDEDNGEEIKYISVCTNKNYCIKEGAKGTDGVYEKLENIKVVDYIWDIDGPYLNKLNYRLYRLFLLYIPNYGPPELVATNVTFILEFTPALGEIVEYLRSYEKKLEVFVEALRNIQQIDNEDNISYEMALKIQDTGEGMDLGTARTPELFRADLFNFFRRELEQAERSNLTTQITVPEGYIGAKIITGELWKGANETYWMFPTTTARTLVTKVGEINAFLDCYDLTRKLHNDIPSLKEYMKIQNGFVYYEKQN